MGVHSAAWEDEENNRIVELAVDYRLDNDHLQLVSVTPVSVTFVDPQSNLARRKIGVWTDTGRRVLLRAVRENVDMQQLANEVSESILAPAE